MASAGSGKNPYAAFSTLPGSKLKWPGLDLHKEVITAELPAHLEKAGYEEELLTRERPHLEAFSFARDVLEEQAQWEVEQAALRKARAERADAMQVATAAAASDSVSPSAGPTASTVHLHFKLPNGKLEVATFDVSQGGFDVYRKAYELLSNKDRVFTMQVRGPRALAPGVPSLNKRLDEGSFSQDLGAFGMRATCSYDVQVEQR
eukprot:TRINITY_DN14339_c0_g1_i2.p1 TRINITY_DN14339_c0_g1~~TRINITY_DN14339_c0_g1_i2.p1  ORF type:complete len:228 (+),score=53.75 TRINITY_DN14339_c0_g1_i2:72-686(+)